jgi:hypothetical protein
LLKGTPDQEAIVDLVAKQTEPYIFISVEGGNIRDLPGSIIAMPGGYLVYKKLFEVNKRPAIYLVKDVAQQLMTAQKGSADVQNDRLLLGGYEFTFTAGQSGFIPVGYASLPNGKKLLHLPNSGQASPPLAPASEANTPPATSIPEPENIPDAPQAVPEPEAAVEKSAETPNRILEIVSAIADDERNLTLIKDIAFTAYSIITTVKKSGSASKEQIAACVVAALAAPENRSRLRRIGGDVFRRFKELNKEAGTVVDVGPGYRDTPEEGLIIDEYPDAEMMETIRSELAYDVGVARINYDRALGYPEDLIINEDAEFGLIAKNMLRLHSRDQDGRIVFTFHSRYKEADVVYSGFRDNDVIALIKDGLNIFETSSAYSDGQEMFGCYKVVGGQHLIPLNKENGLVAENMLVSSILYTVQKQYVSLVLDALMGNIIRVADPVPDDIQALVKKGYKVGSEKKGDSWLLWGFPAGATLNVHGLPKSVVGGVPQY